MALLKWDKDYQRRLISNPGCVIVYRDGTGCEYSPENYSWDTSHFCASSKKKESLKGIRKTKAVILRKKAGKANIFVDDFNVAAHCLNVR